MAVFPELDRAEPAQLIAWFASRNGVHREEEGLWLDEVATRLAETGPGGIRFLISSIPGAKERQLQAIFLALSLVRNKLSSRRRIEICNLGLVFLEDRRARVVAEAIDLLCHLECTSAREQILGLLCHPSPPVVGAVLRYMARHFPGEAIPLLEVALTSKDAIVRQNAVDELDELGRVEALPAIRRLLRDEDRDVRQAARTAVSNLARSRSKPHRPVPQRV